MRIFYFLFVFSLFLLSGLFRSQPERLGRLGGAEYSESRRAVHYFTVAVMVVVSAYGSIIQFRKDWKRLKDKLDTRKNR
jgi:hypothetical protein